MISGLVSNIQKFSLQDGPGLRTTVFLKGCPLLCAWCHNPESISRKPEVVVFEARCVRCGLCVEVCPQQQKRSFEPGKELIGAPEPLAVRDCVICGACVETCPTGARAMMGREMRVDEVVREVLKDRVFYEESKGGVTFSGGEPLVQFEFLKGLLEACRAEGLHTALDTCGFAPVEHLLALAPLVNLFLYDLKFMDDEKHKEFTGVSNGMILENLKQLNHAHECIWLRVPIIPGVNDPPAELEAMAQLAASLPSVRQVNLLPYHKTGIQKFKRLGRDYRLPGVTPASAEYMEAVAQIFQKRGLTIKVGG